MATSTADVIDNPFWRFSLTCYGKGAVADLCIAAQDELGLDVNVVLYGAWLAQENRCLDTAHLRGLLYAVGPWHRGVVVPVRDIRRSLNTLRQPVRRKRLLDLELRCERWQQLLMWRHYCSSPPLPLRQRCLQPNLSLVFSHTSSADPGELLQRLSAAISSPS